MEVERRTAYSVRFFKFFRFLVPRVNNVRRKLSSLKVKILMVIIMVCLVYGMFINREVNTAQPTELVEITDRPMRHVPLNLIYKEQSEALNDLSVEFEEDKTAYMINTLGCKIPIVLDRYNLTKNSDNVTCGKRAVYLRRNEGDRIQVTIKHKDISKLIAKDSTYHCCYSFVGLKDRSGRNRTECNSIRNGDKIILEGDFISVKCYEGTNKIIYEDVYSFCKTKVINRPTCSNNFNVLIVGVNSMSLSRFSQTMTRTVNYFKDNNWLGFRGYHKLSDTNKIANLMTAFIGHDVYMGTEKCSFLSELCHDPIWNRFKSAGYVTAFGEDYLDQADSINKQYSIKEASTHHYLNPFFQNNEREIHDNKLVCTGQKTSAQQLLNYVYDFILAYRSTKFFGFFWMNSFSKYVDNYREDADKVLEDFFNRLTYTGILENTFVILISDHGLQIHNRPLTLEAFYDNQAPAFFMHLPDKFKRRLPEKLMKLKINQFRLITPFDLYDTLYDISEITQCKNASSNFKISESHQSLLDEVSEERTCEKLGIDFEWCSCNRLYSLEKVLPSNLETVKSVQLVQNYLRKRIQNTRTKGCTKCGPLGIKNVTSLYYMIDRQKGHLYHHMSISTTVEGLSYGATVCEQDSQLRFINAKTVQPLSKEFGNCTTNPNDRQFCVCQKLPNCNIQN